VSKADTAALIAVGAVLLGLWLLSDPDCGLGCQTVAQHLITHGIGNLGLG
jgi:hypothetical protein